MYAVRGYIIVSALGIVEIQTTALDSSNYNFFTPVTWQVVMPFPSPMYIMF